MVTERVDSTWIVEVSIPALPASLSQFHAWGPNTNNEAPTAVSTAANPDAELKVCMVDRLLGVEGSLPEAELGGSGDAAGLRPLIYRSIIPIANVKMRLASTPIEAATSGAHFAGSPGHHHKIASGPIANLAGVANNETQSLLLKNETSGLIRVASFRLYLHAAMPISRNRATRYSCGRSPLTRLQWAQRSCRFSM